MKVSNETREWIEDRIARIEQVKTELSVKEVIHGRIVNTWESSFAAPWRHELAALEEMRDLANYVRGH